jgi:tetratricopeptide (TPR) repeat protein
MLYHKALKKRPDSRTQIAKIYNNIAYVHFLKSDCDRAIENWQKSHEVTKKHQLPHLLLALALTRCGRYEEALSHLDDLIEKRSDDRKALNVKGVIRLIQNQPQEALDLFRRCLKLAPAESAYYLNAGAGLHLLGDYQRAEVFLLQALRDTQRDRIALLWNAKNYLAMGKPSMADPLLDELVAKLPFDVLNTWLEMGFKVRFSNDKFIFPAADATLGNLLAAKYRQRSQALEQWSDPLPGGNKLADGSRTNP